VVAYHNCCPHFSLPLNYEPDIFHIFDGEDLMCAHHTAMRPARGFPGRQCCAHRTRTVLNGICFGLRDSLAILEQLGLPPDHLLSGGGVSAACMQSSAPGRPGNLPPVGGGELSFRHAGQHPH